MGQSIFEIQEEPAVGASPEIVARLGEIAEELSEYLQGVSLYKLVEDANGEQDVILLGLTQGEQFDSHRRKEHRDQVVQSFLMTARNGGLNGDARYKELCQIFAGAQLTFTEMYGSGYDLYDVSFNGTDVSVKKTSYEDEDYDDW